MTKSKSVFVVGTSLFLVFGLVYVFSYIFNQNPTQNSSSHWEDKSKADNEPLKYASLKDKEKTHGWETGTKQGWKPGIKYKMVDIKELHVSSNKDSKPNIKGSYKILHYNAELSPFNYATDNHVIKHECSYTNCEFTSDLGQITQSHAVIFHLPKDGSRFTPKPPERKQDQVWILSDINPHEPTDLDIPAIDTTWKNKINWTMSYRLDSDILWTYGTLRTRRAEEFPNKDYYTMVSFRKLKAMTVITNCHEYETNGLKEYVTILKTKIDLDVFGDCKDTKPLPGDLKKVVLDYFFFFLLEETLCPNFFSETFFSFFDLDILIVLRRGSGYLNIIPNDIFVNIADYSDIDSAMKFINSLGNVEVVEYIRKKDNYITAPPVRWQCDMCQKLNNKGDNRRVYKSLTNVLETSVCAENILQLTTCKSGKRMQIFILVAIFVFVVFMFRNYNCRCYWMEDKVPEKEVLPTHS